MRSILSLAALALAACATHVTLPPLPDCHPANPAAAATPLPAPSSLLDVAAPVPAPAAGLPEGHEQPGTAEPMEGHGHHDMGHGKSAMEGHADHGTAPQEGTAAVYVCPMHPDVRSDAPGECPVCGMALEPEGEEREAPAPHEHAHPPLSGGGGR